MDPPTFQEISRGSHLRLQQYRPVVQARGDLRVSGAVNFLIDSQQAPEKWIGFLVLALEYDEKVQKEVWRNSAKINVALKCKR